MLVVRSNLGEDHHPPAWYVGAVLAATLPAINTAYRVQPCPAALAAADQTIFIIITTKPTVNQLTGFPAITEVVRVNDTHWLS